MQIPKSHQNCHQSNPSSPTRQSNSIGVSIRSRCGPLRTIQQACLIARAKSTCRYDRWAMLNGNRYRKILYRSQIGVHLYSDIKLSHAPFTRPRSETGRDAAGWCAVRLTCSTPYVVLAISPGQ